MLTSKLNNYLKQIDKADVNFRKQGYQRQAELAKPGGSLGRLEELSAELCAITRKEFPEIKRKVMFTLAGDHGVVEEGVSAFPQEVTPQMVANFLKNGAAVNVLAANEGAEVIVGDFGVIGEIKTDSHMFRNKKVAHGTRNFTKGPALTEEEAVQALLNGIAIFEEEHAKQKIDLTGVGEMGIGNTTPATAILSVISGMDAEQITGRGTGVDDDGLKRKIEVVRKGIEINQPEADNGLDILQKVGGLEIAGMAGVILAAAKHQVPVMIDGFISTSAALIAYKLNAATADYMIASHSSVECGHRKMMEILGKKPLLDLDLRLGEGTGAVLAINIVTAASRILSHMLTFAEATVTPGEA